MRPAGQQAGGRGWSSRLAEALGSLGRALALGEASGEPACRRLSHRVFHPGYYAERDGLSYSFVGEHEPPAARWQVFEYPSPPPPPAPPPPEKKLLLSNDEVVRRLASARRTGTFDMDGAFG